MNRLGDTHSPYLLQHANQPVDWHPWGDEAFETAHREDKPVFLSIGYATCHWCHVMAHESFDDPRVAALLNETFICVKVDREEYPAVDSHYMAACHLMTGGGGWPLTVLTTPDRVPFYAATYIPKATQPPRLGMLDLIPRIADLWRNNRSGLTDAAGRIANAITAMSFVKPGEDIDPQILDRVYQDLMHRYDAVHGGFDGAPKFPSPHNLLFLLRYWRRTGTWFAREMAEDTLEALRRGGIHDQVGGGFHRYATDETWTIPHFEKMLTDQAMLAISFTEAFHATDQERFGTTVHDIIVYVLRDLSAPDGGFCTAEDADSMGDEGGFYLWSADELTAVIEPGDVPLAMRAFGITQSGNHYDEATRRPTGLNVPHLPVAEELLAEEFGMTVEACTERLYAIRDALYRARENRPRPLLDDKVLTDANGLMIAALAYAARVFGRNDWRDAAIRTAEWVLDTMRDSDGGLCHRHHRGHTGIPGTLDDYQFFAWGLIELYETTFDVRYLTDALALVWTAIDRFGDSEHGGFYLTSADDGSLPVRRKDAFDGALPSGNSVAVLNLTKLARLTGDHALEATARDTCRAFAAQIDRSLSAHAMLLAGHGMLTGGAGEVIVAGTPGATDTSALLDAIDRTYLPDTVVLFRPLDDSAPTIDRIVPGLGEYRGENGAATAYVCHDHACQLPTTDPGTMIARLLKNAGI